MITSGGDVPGKNIKGYKDIMTREREVLGELIKGKLQREGFFKVVKMKSNYEKPSEKKKRIKTENIKRVKKLQKLKNRI